MSEGGAAALAAEAAATAAAEARLVVTVPIPPAWLVADPAAVVALAWLPPARGCGPAGTPAPVLRGAAADDAAAGGGRASAAGLAWPRWRGAGGRRLDALSASAAAAWVTSGGVVPPDAAWLDVPGPGTGAGAGAGAGWAAAAAGMAGLPPVPLPSPSPSPSPHRPAWRPRRPSAGGAQGDVDMADAPSPESPAAPAA
jgi:hypothetical protein